MKNIWFCSESILIWGAIKVDSSKILIRFPTWLASTAYQAVLEEGFQDMYAADSVLIQNGAPCHTSRSMLYLEMKKICLLSDWPSKTCGPFWIHVYPNSISRHPMIYGKVTFINWWNNIYLLPLKVKSLLIKYYYCSN